tara:strand:- start:278 stop:382 length:105 start_codon:yes stop_codon:yes gene_type:complete
MMQHFTVIKQVNVLDLGKIQYNLADILILLGEIV